MNKFTIIHSNGSKWFGEKPDSIEKLLEVLSEKTLAWHIIEKDPKKVINPAKGILMATDQPMYPNQNVTCFFGNFIDLSHVFNIDTNDEDVVKKLTAAIKKNKGYKNENKNLAQSV